MGEYTAECALFAEKSRFLHIQSEKTPIEKKTVAVEKYHIKLNICDIEMQDGKACPCISKNAMEVVNEWHELQGSGNQNNAAA